MYSTYICYDVACCTPQSGGSTVPVETSLVRLLWSGEGLMP